MACVVVDPSRLARLADIAQGLAWERTVMEEAARHGVAPVLVFNVRRGAVADDGERGWDSAWNSAWLLAHLPRRTCLRSPRIYHLPRTRASTRRAAVRHPPRPRLPHRIASLPRRRGRQHEGRHARCHPRCDVAGRGFE